MGFTPDLGIALGRPGNIELGELPQNPSPDYGAFEVGGVFEALSTTSVNSLLQDADPAIFYALDFFAYIITTFQGPRLLAEAAAAGTTAITAAVVQQYPYLPQTTFLENQIAFPLLCVARKRVTTRRHTAGWESDRCQFDLLYALPPMNAGQGERILPILNAIHHSIRKKTTQGFDPGYTPPGGSLGQSPWTLSGVESIGFGHEYNEAESASYGFLEGAGSLLFPCLRMSGYFVERDMYVAAANTFTGGDMEIDLLGPDGSVAQHFMDLSTQQAPSVISLSPAGGTIAGGTTVTITGTQFFLPGPIVRFGTQRATSVVRNSSSSITCVTPAIGGPGTVSVTVQNRDGQAGSLQNAFSYS